MSFIRSAVLQAVALLIAVAVHAQKQVSEEPFHKPVIRNKYLRLLDVWLMPGDTTQFHIHSTPSAFLHYTKTKTSAQVRGGLWTTEMSVPGKSWFRSFAGDTLIHRVVNADTIPFHVTDMEILAAYQPGAVYQPLPFERLYDNEMVAAYHADATVLNDEQITQRGPMIIQLVEGQLNYNNIPTNEKRTMKAGDYQYIQPGTLFSLKPVAHSTINLIIFELK